MRAKRGEMVVTYPPELLPLPDDGDEVEVIVVDPVTGLETIVYLAPSPGISMPSETVTSYSTPDELDGTVCDASAPSVSE